MFSKEESKQIRQEFWIFFGKRHPRKWILYQTGIKDVNLKFSFNHNEALVSLDAESSDPIFRAYYFDKILSLKKVMMAEISEDLIFDAAYYLDNGKEIARCYLKLEGVNIHNKNTWVTVFDFFYATMDRFETFFNTYDDFIKS